MRLWPILLLLLVPAASAYEESEAPQVRQEVHGEDDVVRVWHEPEEVHPGTHWDGFIQFTKDSDVVAVQYQVCNVGNACFAPPHNATMADGNTWTFNTFDYRHPAFDEPVYFEADWRLGVQFLLTEERAGGNTTDLWFPPLGGHEEAEYHYFAFNVSGAETGPVGVPAPGALVAFGAIGLALASCWPRRRLG